MKKILYSIAIITVVLGGCKKPDEEKKAVKGCMDQYSLTYNSNATEDDGSCTYASTAPENRKAVIEEYTGVRCTFCPDGHRRAQAFADANPGKVIILNVHTGSYADPANGWANFTTDWGNALAVKAGMGQQGTGYPGGSVSRNTFEGVSEVTPYKMAAGNQYSLLRRDGWWTGTASPAGDVVLSKSSPVNMAVVSKYNASTREVNVIVELYFTETVENGVKLNVALTEDNIVSFQVDNGNINYSYNHKHMLRDLLTGQWGVEVDASSTVAGSRVQKTFTYKVANFDKNGLYIKPENCHIAAYVNMTDNMNILNGAETTLITK